MESAVERLTRDVRQLTEYVMQHTPYTHTDIQKMDIVDFLTVVDEVSNKIEKTNNGRNQIN